MPTYHFRIRLTCRKYIHGDNQLFAVEPEAKDSADVEAEAEVPVTGAEDEEAASGLGFTLLRTAFSCSMFLTFWLSRLLEFLNFTYTRPSKV